MLCRSCSHQIAWKFVFLIKMAPCWVSHQKVQQRRARVRKMVENCRKLRLQARRWLRVLTIYYMGYMGLQVYKKHFGFLRNMRLQLYKGLGVHLICIADSRYLLVGVNKLEVYRFVWGFLLFSGCFIYVIYG